MFDYGVNQENYLSKTDAELYWTDKFKGTNYKAQAKWDRAEGADLREANPDGHYINPEAVNNDKYEGASNTLAQLNRAQWNDWKARFKPRLEQLAGYAQSGELTQQSVGLARDAVGQSFDSMAATQQRRQSDLGIQMTPAQQAANKRTMGLTEASTTASAMNQARAAGKDRDMQILAGGGSISSNLTQ